MRPFNEEPDQRRSRLTSALAILFSFAMIAAACGGSSSDSADSAGGGSDDGGSEGESASPTTAVLATTAPPESGPTQGGTLVYGMEADSANGWAPYRVSCAISCYRVLATVSDTLFVPNVDGGVSGVLVESYESNADFTEWTFTIRDGIKFHDGEPLDGAAVAFNLNTCRFSSLTGPAVATISDIQAEGQVVTISMSSPWAPFPANMAGGSCSYMFSPKWLASLPDVPMRTEGAPFFSEEIAALPADGDPTAPVGLGAFKFVSYEPGNGNSFVAERNEDYWRGPNGVTGEELPYLDRMELVVAVDIASRSNGVASGEFSIIHTSNADEIVRLEDNPDLNVIKANDFGETSYTMLNVAQGDNPTLAFLRGEAAPIPMDPEGANAENPLVHKACRRALAFATDNQRIADERGAGIVEVANGPFPPGSMGYLEDSGFPGFDIDEALVEWEQCKTDAGTDVISFRFDTTNDPFNVETNELVISMWKEAFGDEIEATISPTEQGSYIGLALTGAFQAQAWRSHGGTDPDTQFLWWFSGTASPIGELALNFGRFQDPVIDAALLTQRATDDVDVRRAAAEDINRSFGENVWNLWSVWNLWGIASNPNVNGITDMTTPDGDTQRGIVSGSHPMIGIWCTDGECNP